MAPLLLPSNFEQELEKEFARVQVRGPMSMYQWQVTVVPVRERRSAATMFARDDTVFVNIRVRTEDSRTGQTGVVITHSRPYMPFETNPVRWLFEQMVSILKHEMGECFFVDGQLPFDPHRNDYG